MSTLDNLLSEEEAAEAMGRSKVWLSRMRRAGKGPEYLFVGNKVHYDRADVDTWLNDQKIKPGEKPHE